MKKYTSTLLALLLISLPVGLFAQDDWPKEIPLQQDGGKIVIYQPQPESLQGNKLSARAAVSVKKTSADEPIFGAIFFDAVLNTDKDSRTAVLESLDVTNAKFPGVENQADVNRLTDLIETDAPKWNLELSIDDLVTSIKKENAGKGDEAFNNAAPKIFYANKPSALVILDGEPKIQNDKDLDADRVVNSPYMIFKEGSQWNMYNGGLWYKSKSITSGWKINNDLSDKLKSVDAQIKTQEKENNNGKEATSNPVETDIIVSTEPAELLQTKGDPDYKTVQGTSLLYVANSPNEIFKDINSQQTYVLLAGRWYSSNSINGPWKYVAADKLPADFAKIPEGSDKDAVLASVAGTDAAEEAKIDAQIPQTAKVDRKTATVDVKYDGSPRFTPIEGTSLQLAENANVTVMRTADGKYFALDNGIWFNANGPDGPWAVANERPKDVENIPPSSAAYNSKYVYVYDVYPDYVYMGYTPGYMGSYIYGPTVVYGTGFYYHPWYGHYFYPRPVTWGFGFNYNPWTGWAVSFGYNYGYMHFGFGFGGGYRYGWGGGWFGPPIYHPPYRPYYKGGGYYGRVNNNITINNINIINNRYHVNNIYTNQRGVMSRDLNRRPTVSNANRPNTAGVNRPINTNPGNVNRGGTPNPGYNNGIGASPNRPVNPNRNNVFADRDGRVYQHDNQGNWSQRDNQNRTWKPATREANPNIGNMSRESIMRDRGAARTQNYNQYRSAGGGGNHGGGNMNRGGGGSGGNKGGGGHRH